MNVASKLSALAGMEGVKCGRQIPVNKSVDKNWLRRSIVSVAFFFLLSSIVVIVCSLASSCKLVMI